MADMARLLRRIGGSRLTRDQSSAERLSVRYKGKVVRTLTRPL